MENQPILDLSQFDIEEMTTRAVPEETISPDLYNFDEILSERTPEQTVIFDSIVDLDDSLETFDRFMLEANRIRNKYGFLEKTEFNKLASRYLTQSAATIIPATPKPAMTQQIVFKRNSNIRPGTVRPRNRQQPSQNFRRRQ